MPRVPLFPRNPQFFALLDRASENLVEAADALHAMLAGFPEAGSLAERGLPRCAALVAEAAEVYARRGLAGQG